MGLRCLGQREGLPDVQLEPAVAHEGEAAAGVQTVFPPGAYTVQVRVDSDTARRAEGVFRIDFTRGWNQITITDTASG